MTPVTSPGPRVSAARRRGAARSDKPYGPEVAPLWRGCVLRNRTRQLFKGGAGRELP